MYLAACKVEFQPFTVVLTADVFQLFIKWHELMGWLGWASLLRSIYFLNQETKYTAGKSMLRSIIFHKRQL